MKVRSFLAYGTSIGLVAAGGLGVGRWLALHNVVDGSAAASTAPSYGLIITEKPEQPAKPPVTTTTTTAKKPATTTTTTTQPKPTTTTTTTTQPKPTTTTTTTTAKPEDDGQAKKFTMAGSITGLLLGSPQQLSVLVTNPNTKPITLKTLTATAANASAACTASANLKLGSYNSTTVGALVYTIPAKGSATVKLPIELLNIPNVNQNACKLVTFPLTFTGTAVQAA